MILLFSFLFHLPCSAGCSEGRGLVGPVRGGALLGDVLDGGVCGVMSRTMQFLVFVSMIT